MQLLDIRKQVHETIDFIDSKNAISIIFNYLILGLIILNLVAVVLESFEDISRQFDELFSVFEDFSIGVFTVEYALRVWTARIKFSSDKHPYLRYFFSFLAVVDLISILPFYVSFLVSVDLRYLRIVRLARLVRLFKLTRYVESMGIIRRVLRRERDILVTAIFLMAMLLFLSSCLMYAVENAAQPSKFPNIVATMWWAVVTLTTVGYGDVYPITPLGKVLAGVIAVLGIGVVALPTGIISSGFIAELNRRRKKEKNVCPHCGKEIDRE